MRATGDVGESNKVLENPTRIVFKKGEEALDVVGARKEERDREEVKQTQLDEMA